MNIHNSQFIVFTLSNV